MYINEETLLCGSCGNGYYVDNEYCRKCNESCKTCTDGTPFSCTVCSDNLKRRPDNTC